LLRYHPNEITSAEILALAKRAKDDAETMPYPQRGPIMDCAHSSASMNLATNWLKKYITSYPECNRLSIGAKIPTRLLELGYLGPDHIRLRNTADITMGISYMTLSHCWGSAEFLKLTVDTEHQLLEGIHLSKLPRTFQDAIRAAQRLGVQYIWIDSPCLYLDRP
jgi:hypothetical protein